jgi:hypothetical protein
MTRQQRLYVLWVKEHWRTKWSSLVLILLVRTNTEIFKTTTPSNGNTIFLFLFCLVFILIQNTKELRGAFWWACEVNPQRLGTPSSSR